MGRREIRWWCLLVLQIALGCSESSPATDDHVEVSRYGELPGLTQTHHQALRAELARLQSERATPELMKKRGGALGVANTEPRYDGALAIEKAIPAESRQQLLADLAEFYPSERFVFDQRSLQRAAELRARYLPQLFAFRQLAEHPHLEFAWEPRKGFGDELTFVDLTRAGCQLTALEIADFIEHGRLSESVDGVILLFRVCQSLADVQHLVPRIAAVHQRREILEVVSAICQHSACDLEINQRLLYVLTSQLAGLPPDEAAWIGDRAAGLHLYELIRDGYLLSVLTYDELREFREEIGIEQLGKRVSKNLDEDELFYLTTMRETIEGCQQPFYKRAPAFRQIKRSLNALRESADYPFVADYFLLAELFAGQRYQALDRARLEAWQLALQAAAAESPEPPTNPLTGYPYILDVRTDRVVVAAIDPESHEPPVEIPIRRQ